MADAPEGERFDAAYYERFYGDARTRVVSQAETAKLAAFVSAYLRYLELPVVRVLDMGCGIGLWQEPLRAEFPGASYRGVEVSRYLCDKHGWDRGTVDSYRGRGRFDLVVCQGVLQYLETSAAEAAIHNLARLCRGALYLEVLTREDWEQNVDQARTDGDVHLRPANWYRPRLAEHFDNAGGGVFVKREAPVTFYELERI